MHGGIAHLVGVPSQLQQPDTPPLLLLRAPARLLHRRVDRRLDAAQAEGAGCSEAHSRCGRVEGRLSVEMYWYAFMQREKCSILQISVNLIAMT